jgi:hypothetical protein
MATAIGTILILEGTTEPSAPLFNVLTLESMTVNESFSYDDTVFTAITTRMAQPIQPAGFVSGVGSPNITRKFIVEVLYPAGLGPNLANTVETFRLQAITAINANFGITLT